MAVRTKVLGFLLVCAMLGCLVAADARGAQPFGPGQPAVEAFEGEGVIELVAPGKLQIVNNANQRCMVILTPQTKVELTGTATVDALRPGLGVRFTATMDKQGVVKEKVTQLTIFTPSQENPLGFWSAEGPPAAGGAPTGGAAPGGAPAAGDPFGFGKKLDDVTGKPAGKPAAKPAGKPAGKPGGKPAGKAAAAEAGSYIIAGRVTAYHAGKLQLTTGNAAIKAEVAPDAQVDLKFSDYTAARKGDRITVSGQTIPKSGLVQAAAVKITSVEPVVVGKVKPGKPAKPTKEPRTPKKTPKSKEAAE